MSGLPFFKPVSPPLCCKICAFVDFYTDFICIDKHYELLDFQPIFAGSYFYIIVYLELININCIFGKCQNFPLVNISPFLRLNQKIESDVQHAECFRCGFFKQCKLSRQNLRQNKCFATTAPVRIITLTMIPKSQQHLLPEK